MFAAGRGMEEAVGMGAGSPHNADPTVRFSDRWKSDRLNEAIGVPKDQWDKVWNDNVAERQAHVESNPQYIEELRGVLQKHLSDDNLNVPGKELHDAIDRATGKEIQPEKPVVESKKGEQSVLWSKDSNLLDIGKTLQDRTLGKVGKLLPGEANHEAIVNRASGAMKDVRSQYQGKILSARKSENNTVDKRAAAMGLTNKP